MDKWSITELGSRTMTSPNSSATSRFFSTADVFSMKQLGAPPQSVPRLELIVSFVHEFRMSSRAPDGSLTVDHQFDLDEQSASAGSTALDEFLSPNRTEDVVQRLLSGMPIPDGYLQVELEGFVSSCARVGTKAVNRAGLAELVVVAYVKVVTEIVCGNEGWEEEMGSEEEEEEEEDWRCPVSLEIAEASLEEEAGDHCYSGGGEVCTVCLEESGPREGRARMRCSHGFHRECILKWLTESSNSCPVCRYKI